MSEDIILQRKEYADDHALPASAVEMAEGRHFRIRDEDEDDQLPHDFPNWSLGNQTDINETFGIPAGGDDDALDEHGDAAAARLGRLKTVMFPPSATGAQ